MKGWVMIDAAGYAVDADLEDWIRQGVAFAQGWIPSSHYSTVAWYS
jgi:hypothetical protein